MHSPLAQPLDEAGILEGTDAMTEAIRRSVLERVPHRRRAGLLAGMNLDAEPGVAKIREDRGAVPVVIARDDPERTLHDVALDQQFVYWANEWQISRLPLGTADQSVPVVRDDGVIHFVIDGATIYYTVRGKGSPGGYVRKVPRQGRSPPHWRGGFPSPARGRRGLLPPQVGQQMPGMVGADPRPPRNWASTILRAMCRRP
jgi:hypothetical protein